MDGVAYIQQIFWARWKEEYFTPKPGLIVDDLNLVKDENLPPLAPGKSGRASDRWRRRCSSCRTQTSNWESMSASQRK